MKDAKCDEKTKKSLIFYLRKTLEENPDIYIPISTNITKGTVLVGDVNVLDSLVGLMGHVTPQFVMLAEPTRGLSYRNKKQETSTAFTLPYAEGARLKIATKQIAYYEGNRRFETQFSLQDQIRGALGLFFTKGRIKARRAFDWSNNLSEASGLGLYEANTFSPEFRTYLTSYK